MVVLTEGLRAIAGDAMRAALMRFTHSPLSGAVTGATTTAVLQSSSATTVAAVGFVGAGLLGFSESLGIIFGANLGTTLKGWLVALLGFKLNLGTVVLPVILIGAIMRLFGRGRSAQIGYAMAGFGLIFVGITTMQHGMAGLEGIISPERLPDDTLGGRLLLVLMGMIFTAITQSSSAGVATALTALYTGAISFPQAAALVIGMDVGTTVTAAIASIGGTNAARRTGLSHVIYNIMTGLGALILLSPYMWLWEAVAPGAMLENAEIALVGFHSGFNLVCISIVIPFTYHFARFVQRVLPEGGEGFTDNLDRNLLREPQLALDAAQDSLLRQLKALLNHTGAILGVQPQSDLTNLTVLQAALDETQGYVDRIHLKEGDGEQWKRLLAIYHTLDHMQRLHERCEEEEDRAVTARESVELEEVRNRLGSCLPRLYAAYVQNQWGEAVEIAAENHAWVAERVEPLRALTVEQVAHNDISVAAATNRMEAIRWLMRVSRHLARINHHLATAMMAVGKS